MPSLPVNLTCDPNTTGLSVSAQYQWDHADRHTTALPLPLKQTANLHRLSTEPNLLQIEDPKMFHWEDEILKTRDWDSMRTATGLGLAPIRRELVFTAWRPGLTFSGYTPSLGCKYWTCIRGQLGESVKVQTTFMILPRQQFCRQVDNSADSRMIREHPCWWLPPVRIGAQVASLLQTGHVSRMAAQLKPSEKVHAPRRWGRPGRTGRLS